MSDKHFFNNFFTKNKLWNEIQSNPIAHQALWSSYYPGRTIMNLTRANGTNIYDAARHGAYSRRIQYYPPPEPTRRTIALYNRAKLTPLTKTNDTPTKRFQTNQQVKDYWRSFKRKPAPGTDLPYPVDTREKYFKHIYALMAAGQYRVTPLDRNDPDQIWWQDTDYWFPDYEGDFKNLVEKSVKKIPIPPYDNDAPFLPPKFMTNKQKESYVWMVGGNEMFNL